MQNFENIEATEGELSQFEIDDIDLKILPFQAGYITIKSYNVETRNYMLGYTNKETVDSLGEHILKSMIGTKRSFLVKTVVTLFKAFIHHDFEQVFSLLTGFLQLLRMQIKKNIIKRLYILF